MNFTQLLGLASGHAEARILQTAVSLGVFEALESAPQPSQNVATELHLDPAATELLLNALAALDLIEKHAQLFGLTEAAKRYLLRSSPQYVGAMVRFEDLSWSAWGKLPEALRTGKPVRPADMYQEDQNETAIFIDAMDSLVKARGDTDALIEALDWENVGTVLDVGSGPGTYSIALCRKFNHLRATIFDLPGTLRITERHVLDAGMSKRITLTCGDYRKDPPAGKYDLVFLSNIIHGENRSRNEALFGELSRNLNASGRMVIKDHILDETRTDPAVGAIFSLLMLLTTDGGRCYSFGEIRAWMEHAGLSRVHQLALPAPLTSSLVIGTLD